MARLAQATTALTGKVYEPTGKQGGGLPKKQLVAPANAPFQFKWHPDNIEFRPDLGGWVHRLVPFHERKGVGGVDNRGNTRNAVALLMERGWSVIKRDDPRLGEGFRGFVRAYDIQGGGTHHAPPWYVVHLEGNRVRKTYDASIHREFLAHCYERGILPPVSELAKVDLTKRQEGKVSRLQGVYDRTGSTLHHSRLKDSVERLALMNGDDPATVAVPLKGEREQRPAGVAATPAAAPVVDMAALKAELMAQIRAEMAAEAATEAEPVAAEPVAETAAPERPAPPPPPPGKGKRLGKGVAR